jgi:hypothetical protein
MIRKMYAENITRRIPIAFAGLVDKPLARPVHATAYKADDGTVLIAVVEGKGNGGNVEVSNRTRVLVSYDVEADCDSVRMCHTCDADKPHPRRITPHNGKGYCDASAKRTRAARKGKPRGAFRTERVEARRAELDATVASILARVEPTREQMKGNVLRAIANSVGTDSTRWAAMLSLYGMTHEAGLKLADLDERVSVAS